MADQHSYSTLLSQVAREWDRAESAIKQAELVSNSVVMPAVSSLRYAGRKIVEALGLINVKGDDESIALYLQNALFDCAMARYDATDAITAKIAIDLEIIAKSIGYQIILSKFPDFPNLVRRLSTIRNKLAEARGMRRDREAIYAAVQDDLSELIEMYASLKNSEEIMVSIARARKRELIFANLLAISGLVVGVASLVYAFGVRL